jgi:hypothetical protein
MPKKIHEWTITKDTCDLACTNGHCIITGDGFCGHPIMNAAQPKHSRMPEVMRRRGGQGRRDPQCGHGKGRPVVGVLIDGIAR